MEADHTCAVESGKRKPRALADAGCAMEERGHLATCHGIVRAVVPSATAERDAVLLQPVHVVVVERGAVHVREVMESQRHRRQQKSENQRNQTDRKHAKRAAVHVFLPLQRVITERAETTRSGVARRACAVAQATDQWEQADAQGARRR